MYIGKICLTISSSVPPFQFWEVEIRTSQGIFRRSKTVKPKLGLGNRSYNTHRDQDFSPKRVCSSVFFVPLSVTQLCSSMSYLSFYAPFTFLLCLSFYVVVFILCVTTTLSRLNSSTF